MPETRSVPEQSSETDHVDDLVTLLELGRLLNSSLDLPLVLETAIEQVIGFVGAERGFILLVELPTGNVRGEAVRGLEKAALEATLTGADSTNQAGISRSIVEKVLETRTAVLSHNAMEDPRFAQRQSVHLAHLRSVLCVPLLTQGRLLGVIYLDNRVRTGVFTERQLSMLSAFANQAAVALENARLYANLSTSLNEQLQLQEALYRKETQRLALEEASRMKSEFLGIVAHELRNPLTTITGYVQTLLADVGHTLDHAIRTEFYEAIAADADRLQELISELLDVSRIEAGRPLSLVLKPVALQPVIDRQLRRMRFDKFVTPRHRLQAEVAPDLAPTLLADESKLNQIISNLLSNAVKYSPEGGPVTLCCRNDPENPDRVCILVRDAGIGLTPEQQERLFQSYERLERDEISNIPGTGLGLFLVKNLVALHGGTISVESAPGLGSTFTVRLPRNGPGSELEEPEFRNPGEGEESA